MGSDATASLSYGFIIPQPKVLELLQKLQNSTEKITPSAYGIEDAQNLEELLDKHLKEGGIGEQHEDFEMVFLTSREDIFNGLAFVYNGIGIERVTVWGFGSQKLMPLLSEPWDKDELEDANIAFDCLRKDSLFKELEIEVEPGWLLGCGMSQ